MEDKILNSVVEITEQRNSLSLGHCLVATLLEMMPIESIRLVHYLSSTSIVVASVYRHGENNDYQWRYDQAPEQCYSHEHSHSVLTINQLNSTQYVCQCPIPISEQSSALLEIETTSDPSQFELLIDGFSKIYRNYLIVLHESERDKLTGLLNRKTLEERLSHSFNLASGHEAGEQAWVAIIDLDLFKGINDTYGHMIGDEVLLMFSQQLQNFFSEQVQLFRFGGEEFVLLLPPQEKQQVINELDRFRRHIEAFRFPRVNSMTFSCGVCAISRHEYLPTILGHADTALYSAKENGRNRIECYEDLILGRAGPNDDDHLDYVELF
ncbi:GGDEF domain-containing protein [Vibrio sp. Isolate23]|uniref:GGDEF domain-containing protein n=1 Tax=Vibrio sp. Isolate23 TaxID=2908533 RepID=UPI001EFEECFE|nr:GGDEF domain-containing protein [Vibrio sp. Isolate23]MCG9682528.1 GGDEF domain-containing protein [Vibrio sp. Isolate23]